MSSAPLTPKNGAVALSTPRIIARGEHPITLAMLDQDALNVLKKLQGAGFAGYLVGGGVRDLYLGRLPKDFDISTDARPGQLRRLFPHSNTIGRRFRLVQVYFRGGKTIEISTLRSLSEHDLDGPENVLAPNNTFGTLSEDAQRRDLTINSLFFEIGEQSIIDYVNGIDDLDRAIIRIVGEPEKRIGRDPVRILRAIRHAARTGFTIEAKSWTAIVGNCDKLPLCPPSRLRDEILKDLHSAAAAPWFELAAEAGVFTTLFPLYRGLLGEDDRGSQVSKIEQGTGNPVHRLLSRMFTAVDQLVQLAREQRIPPQPDHLLFAMLLLPWVEWRCQLFSRPRPNPELFQLTREIRAEIDQGIGVELNLSRSLRQETLTSLTSLALLLHNRQERGWPKWLRKKSYFQRTLLFYHLYLQATAGTPLPAEVLPAAPTSLPPASSGAQAATNQTRRDAGRNRQRHPDAPPRQPKRVEGGGGGAPSRPAFAPSTKGGVFGLKK